MIGGYFFMKNFLMLLFSIIFTIASLTIMHYMEKDLLFKDAMHYTFYSQSVSSQAKIISTTAKDAKKVKYSIANLTGESAEYKNAEDAFQQIDRYNANFRFMEECGDIQNYYFYSPNLYAAVHVNGIAVNLHIAIKIDGVTIGSPLIFGGF